MTKASKKKTKNTPKRKVSKSTAKKGMKDWMLALSIAAFGFILYANSIQNGYVLDDELVCSRNDFVQSGFAGLGDIFTGSWYEGFNGEKDRYYRPMMLAGFAIEKQIFGHKASVYHFMNVLTYAFILFLLFYVLRLMFRKQSFWLPLGISLLFAAHPIHTEVVANIKSRDELYALLGLLGMLYGLLRYSTSDQNKHLILAFCAYAFSLFSKESSLAFLVLVPLGLYFFSELSFKKIGTISGGFVALAAVYFLIRMQVISAEPDTFGVIDNGLFSTDSRSMQLASAIGMIGKYVMLLIFPHPLSFDYSFNQIPLVGWGNIGVILSLIFSVGLIAYAIYRTPQKDPIAFSVFWIIATFVVTSNILFLIGASFAERFMFIPSLGFCMMVGILIDQYLRKNQDPPNMVYYGFMGIILVLFSLKTIDRNNAWQSNFTLFSTDINTASNSTRVQSHYAKALYDQALATADPVNKKRLLEQSIEHFTKSIEIHPENIPSYQNMGLAYDALGNKSKALESYDTGIKLKPDYFPMYTNAGLLQYNLGNYPKAVDYLSKAYGLAPNNPTTVSGLGAAYMKMNNNNEAIKYLKIAHELQPKNINTIGNLVTIYKGMNEIETAIFYDKKIKAIREGQ